MFCRVKNVAVGEDRVQNGNTSKACRAKPCPKFQIPSDRTESNGIGEFGAQWRQGRSNSPVPT